MNVVANTVKRHDLAEQVGTAVSELRDEMTKLVTGVSDCQRLGAFGNAISGKDFGAFRTGQGFWIKAEVSGQVNIEAN